MKQWSCSGACVALLMSSCWSTVSSYAWEHAKVAEQAWWVPQDAPMELYAVGNEVYAKGYKGRARGCYKGVPFFIAGMGNGHSFVSPVQEGAEVVYVPLWHTEEAAALQAEAAGEREVTITLDAPRYATEQLPPNARKLNVAGHCLNPDYAITVNEDDFCCGTNLPLPTDAHKYYAYPIGAVLFVAVDVPLTLAASAVGVGACVVALPHNLYHACVQQGGETPSAVQPNEKTSAK